MTMARDDRRASASLPRISDNQASPASGLRRVPGPGPARKPRNCKNFDVFREPGGTLRPANGQRAGPDEPPLARPPRSRGNPRGCERGPRGHTSPEQELRLRARIIGERLPKGRASPRGAYFTRTRIETHRRAWRSSSPRPRRTPPGAYFTRTRIETRRSSRRILGDAGCRPEGHTSPEQELRRSFAKSGSTFPIHLRPPRGILHQNKN